MSTKTVTVAVPAAAGFGAAADVSDLAGQKTVQLSGTFTGAYVLYGSHNGTNYAPLLSFNANGLEEVKQTFAGAYRYVKLLSRASNPSSVVCRVSGLQNVGANTFTGMTLPAGFSGLTPVEDLGDVNYQVDLCGIVQGGFVGTLIFYGSLDGSNFNPIGSVTSPPSTAGQQPLEFSPMYTTDKVRYLQARVVGVTTTAVALTMGGGKDAEMSVSEKASLDIVTKQQRSLKVLAIGDSQLCMVTKDGTAAEAIDFARVHCGQDAIWNGTTAAWPCTDINSVNVITNCTDPFTGNPDPSKGSLVNQLHSFMRACAPNVEELTTANIGIPGSSSYTWAGELASGYVAGNLANANDGDTLRVGTITYRFKTVTAVAYDVEIGVSAAATLTNLCHAINGSGTGWVPGVANPDCWVANPSSLTYFRIFAKVVGTAGNSITIQSSNSTRIAALTPALSPTTNPVPMTGGSATAALYTNGLAATAALGTPDLALIMLGTNDAYHADISTNNNPSYAANMQLVVDHLKATYPNIKIILTVPPVSATVARTTWITNVALPALTTIAASDPTNIKLFNALALGAGSGGTAILSVDGVHLTNYGFTVVAQGDGKLLTDFLA